MKRIVKKIRWVKRGAKKSKGWKKTGKTRNREYVKNGEWIAIMNPPKGRHRPFPDQWITHVDQEMCFNVPFTTNNFGNVNGNYFNVLANSAYRTFTGSQISNTSGFDFNAGAGTGAGSQGFGGIATPAYSLNNNMPNVGTFANLYQRYLMLDSRIEVELDLQSIGDTLLAVVAPLVDGFAIPTTNIGLASTQLNKAKIKECSAYGQTGNRNIVKNYVNIQYLAGRPSATVEELLSTGLYDSDCALTSYPTKRLGWLVMARSMDGTANASQLNVRVKIRNKIMFYKPQEYANL